MGELFQRPAPAWGYATAGETVVSGAAGRGDGAAIGGLSGSRLLQAQRGRPAALGGADDAHSWGIRPSAAGARHVDIKRRVANSSWIVPPRATRTAITVS